MEEIVIQLKDKNKVQLLTDLLQALDFVSSVRVAHKKNGKSVSTKPKDPIDFFAFAGLWADRDLTITTLRDKAWPRQQP
jgi:hypothetical protein